MRLLEEKKLLQGAVATMASHTTDRVLPEHQLECAKLVFFSRASGTVDVEGHRYPLQKGAVLVLPPYTPHRILLVGEAEYTDLLVSDAFLHSDNHRLACQIAETSVLPAIHRPAVYYPNAGQGKWLSLWLERMALWEGKTKGEDFTKLFTLEFSALWLVLSSLSQKPSPGLTIAEPLPEIKDYINKHFAENLTLEQLAQRYSYSPFHLSRSFKEKEGIGFKDYLLAKRLDHACRLLIEGRWSITEICPMAGFSNRSFFYRYFRKQKGMTPDEFRKKHFPKY